MLVSRKNLALIHFVPGETATRVDVTKAAHQGVHFLAAARLRGELHEPFAKCGVQGLALCPRHQACLLDEVFVGTESYIFH